MFGMLYRTMAERHRGLVAPLESPSGDAGTSNAPTAEGHTSTVFLQYYSIGSAGRRPAKSHRKPQREDELKGHNEGPHSILGIVAQSMERFGQPKHYILWNLSYAELMAMNMDVTRYISAEEEKEIREEAERNRRPKEFTEEYFQTKFGGL